MKFQNLLSVILFFLMTTFISCEEKRIKFANFIKTKIQNMTMPAGTQDLVNNFSIKLTLLFRTATLDQLSELLSKFDLSDSFINKIKFSPYVLNSAIIKFENLKASFYSHEKSVIVVAKEKDGEITFALIKAKTFANLKVRYNVYSTKKCHKCF